MALDKEPPLPESTDELDFPEDFDRSAAHRWALKELRQLRPALRESKRLIRRYRRIAESARIRQREARTVARLHSISVQELARGSGVKVNNLPAAGIFTILDVLNRSDDELKVIKGIGPKSASTLRQRASSLAAIRPEDLRIPADPSRWTAEDKQLVRALQSLSYILMLVGLPHAAVLQQLVSALRLFKRATGFLRWLLGGDARRNRTRSQQGSLRADTESSQARNAIGRMRDGLEKARLFSSVDISDADLLKNWRSSSAGLQALFDEVFAASSTSEERAVARHGLALDKLSPQLVRIIEAAALNKTLLLRNLRPYQEFGAKFALMVQRALLGDEMGLGKTIEALAAIGHAISEQNQRYHVVLCPASLIDNWHREIASTLSEVGSWTYRDRFRDSAFTNWIEKGGILLTTYRQAAHLLGLRLPSIGFLVVDEAHLVKNPKTLSAAHARDLSSRAECVLLMGGTLMENRAGDLIALTSLIDAEKGYHLRSQFGNGLGPIDDPEAFRSALATFYLRRNQKEVLTELPGIVEKWEYVWIGEPEHLAYKRALEQRNIPAARIALTVGDGQQSKKIERLREILEENRLSGQKILVFSEFREPLREAIKAAEALDIPSFSIHGGIRAGLRPGIIDSFVNCDGSAARCYKSIQAALALISRRHQPWC